MSLSLILGDCIEKMKNIESNSIDLICTDLPYGTTKCKWDIVIPFEELWSEYIRLIKDTGAIVLFGKEPFSSKLRVSNLDMYKYDWIWVKDTKSNYFFNISLQDTRLPYLKRVLYSVSPLS